MLIPFGILSSAGGVGEVGDYELIETHILASAVSSITFSSLATHASTYKHLQIRLTARTDRAGASGDFISMRLNGNTGTNYGQHALRGLGASVSSIGSGSQSSIFIGETEGGASVTNSFSSSVADILDAYSTTKNKTVRILHGVRGSQTAIYLSSGFLNNTDSLSSVTFINGFGANFVAGSRFSLYGIKG